MKVIDIYNKIANGKDYKKIKFIFNDYTYTWNDRKHDYDSQNTKHLETGILGYLGFDNYQLNRKIEILDDDYLEDTPKEEVQVLSRYSPPKEGIFKDLVETDIDYNLIREDKKLPEKLDDILRVDDLIPPVDENMDKIWIQTIKNQNKINEIIDYLEYLKSKGE